VAVDEGRSSVRLLADAGDSFFCGISPSVTILHSLGDLIERHPLSENVKKRSGVQPAVTVRCEEQNSQQNRTIPGWVKRKVENYMHEGYNVKQKERLELECRTKKEGEI